MLFNVFLTSTTNIHLPPFVSCYFTIAIICKQLAFVTVTSLLFLLQQHSSCDLWPCALLSCMCSLLEDERKLQQ